MKSLFKNKFVEITLIKGFALGIGLNDSNNTEFIIMFGFICFELKFPKKEVKSLYEI